MNLRSLYEEAWRFISAVRRYGVNPVSAAVRYLRLYRRRRFSPDEIHFYRVLDSNVSESDLQDVISKEELLLVQRGLNPAHLHVRTEDKICFYEYCLNAALPVAEIFAVYDPDEVGSSSAIPMLSSAEAVAGFLQGLPAASVIVKPVSGVSGKGVMRLDRKDGKWLESGGVVVEAVGLVRRMKQTSFRRWIFQKVINGHPALCELSDTRALQTVRVVTVIDENDQVRVLAARLRLICGEFAHDNFAFGKTGNVIAILDPNDGHVRSAVGGARKYCEMRSVTHHPVTGRNLIGYAVPEWEAVRRLAIEAADAFRPLRTIGWDVAITLDGPCLIEGNVTWDTLSGDPRMGDFYRYLNSLRGTPLPADKPEPLAPATVPTAAARRLDLDA